jgi:arylsulfatase A-like enzyme
MTIGLVLLTSCSRAPRPPMNVVLISLDTMRPDRMSLYGAPRRTTPVLDDLAKRSVRFTNAFTPSPWTLPAHAAMLTGRYPSSLSSKFDDHLYRLAPLLSSLLKSHGYRTGAVTAGAFVSKSHGADIGFDSFRYGTITEAVAWIQKLPGEPFFFFFHTYQPHLPHKDRRYVGAIDGGRLKGIYDGNFQNWSHLHLLITCGWMTPTDAEKEFIVSLYDSGVAAADELVGQLLEALDRAGLLQRTMIIVTSDHGEELWEHTGRGPYHGQSLYNELLRIPLQWYEPDLPSSGSTRSELVSLIDIVPTVLARLGFESPPGIDGMDLSPLLDGAAWNVDRALFAEATRHGPPRRSVISTAGKLIAAPDPAVQLGEGQRCAVPPPAPYELYLPDDAAEKRNRFGDHAQLAERLASKLQQTSGRAGPLPSPSVPRPPLDAETKERLRALGYTD